MELTIEGQLIKDFLDLGPFIPLTTTPMFRLVWSDDQYEVRKATIRDYFAGIFIRERKVIENVEKYNWIKERWILEQWYPPYLVLSEELPESDKGSFEPIYVFEDKDKRALPLSIKAVKFLIHRIVDKPRSSSMLIRSTIEEEMMMKELAQTQYDEDSLEVSTPLQTQLRLGEAVQVPQNYISENN